MWTGQPDGGSDGGGALGDGGGGCAYVRVTTVPGATAVPPAGSLDSTVVAMTVVSVSIFATGMYSNPSASRACSASGSSSPFSVVGTITNEAAGAGEALDGGADGVDGAAEGVDGATVGGAVGVAVGVAAGVVGDEIGAGVLVPFIAATRANATPTMISNPTMPRTIGSHQARPVGRGVVHIAVPSDSG